MSDVSAPDTKPKEKEKSSLVPRVVSALVGVPILIGICVWGVTPFVLFTVALALIARTEITKTYARQNIQPNGLLSMLGALVPAAVLLIPEPFGWTTPSTLLPMLLLLAFGLIGASIWETIHATHTPDIRTGQNLAYGLLSGAYISLFGGVALLRLYPWHKLGGPTPGLDATVPVPSLSGASLVLLTMACTIATDSGAFFVGKATGKHKLAETLSPNKTTEGLFGGIAASLLVGAIISYFLLHSVTFGLMVGAAAGLLGPLGDLFKSALKREIGVKDFGSLIPGHGGVLDRFDSLLFTAPVVVLLAKIFNP